MEIVLFILTSILCPILFLFIFNVVIKVLEKIFNPLENILGKDFTTFLKAIFYIAIAIGIIIEFMEVFKNL